MKLTHNSGGQSSVSFLKISKDGKYINKFITTKSTAVQHKDDSTSLGLPEKYLRKVSHEKHRKVRKNHMSNNRSVRNKPLEDLNDIKLTESVMKNVLQGLVDLLKPTEVVKFVTPLCASAINNELIEPSNIIPAQYTDEGEIVKEAVSDLYVAIVSSSQSTSEESAVFILKQSLLDKDSTLTRIISKVKSNDTDRQVLDLHPDNPQAFQKIATKLRRKKKNEETSNKISKLEVLCLVEIVKDTRVNLKGGGEILLSSKNTLISLNTSSVRSMWGFYNALQKAKEVSQYHKLEYGSFTERISGSHSWVAQYFDDSNTITQTGNNEINNNIIDEEEEDIILNKPNINSLMSSLKRILAGFDIDDITMKDVYDGLITIHGDYIIGPNGFTKAEIDKYTMRAVGQLEPPSQILDNLYLGSEYNACNKSELESLDIDLVVNVTEEVENFFQDKFRYFTISLKDVPSSELKPYFREAIQKIKDTIDSGRSVLVHCQRGVSRSATIVISFLMMTRNMTAQEAIDYAKSRRSIVKPNKGFLLQLEAFESELNSA